MVQLLLTSIFDLFSIHLVIVRLFSISISFYILVVGIGIGLWACVSGCSSKLIGFGLFMFTFITMYVDTNFIIYTYARTFESQIRIKNSDFHRRQ